MLAVAVALELEHAVDEMLEDARAGHRAVLRHMADEEDGDARLLRHAQEPRGRLAHLGHGTGRRADLRRMKRLDRVDDADVRAARASSVAQTVSSPVSARISIARRRRRAGPRAS